MSMTVELVPTNVGTSVALIKHLICLGARGRTMAGLRLKPPSDDERPIARQTVLPDGLQHPPITTPHALRVVD
eukprot:5483495-Pyramimonas_sp.AAC.1